MFVDASIPESFNKIVKISDNYIILTQENVLNNNQSYEVYIQFIDQSHNVLHFDDYRIDFCDADNISFDYNYINNGYFSYLEDSNISFSTRTYELEDDSRTYSFWERGNSTSILITCVIIVSFVLKMISYVTSLADKENI